MVAALALASGPLGEKDWPCCSNTTNGLIPLWEVGGGYPGGVSNDTGGVGKLCYGGEDHGNLEHRGMMDEHPLDRCLDSDGAADRPQ